MTLDEQLDAIPSDSCAFVLTTSDGILLNGLFTPAELRLMADAVDDVQLKHDVTVDQSDLTELAVTGLEKLFKIGSQL